MVEKHCVPCKKGEPPLKGAALKALYEKLDGWTLVNEHHLEKSYCFKNFKDALAFTNKVGELAEREGHHPDIHLSWGRVVLEIWTHKIDGLTENDFILAASCDMLLDPC